MICVFEVTVAGISNGILFLQWIIALDYEITLLFGLLQVHVINVSQHVVRVRYQCRPELILEAQTYHLDRKYKQRLTTMHAIQHKCTSRATDTIAQVKRRKQISYSNNTQRLHFIPYVSC